jgi:hypothetical protein
VNPKKKRKPDDPEQSANFIEAAGKLELVDNPKEAFEEALKKIAKVKRSTTKKKPLSHKPV